jgi:hypothetical protein
MIISFNPSLFESDDDEILQQLSQIFDLIVLKRQLIDVVDIDSFLSTILNEDGEYIFNEAKFSEIGLSPIDKRRLEDFFTILLKNYPYLTKVKRKYLTTLHIGLEDNEISPQLALKILSNPSKIIVENAVNDWKFIRGIVAKYAKHPERKSIYLFIKNSVEILALEAEHAGGKGQIRNRFEDLKDHRYKDIYQYKLMTIFDSDRDNNITLNHEQNALINYFKGKAVGYEDARHENSDSIIWHMFYKREVENYVPVDILITEESALTEKEKEALVEKSPEDIDFLNYVAFLDSNKSINVKQDFPEMFLKDWTRNLLEKRCEQHKEYIELPNGTLEKVSEIEVILLKIAKII